MRYFVFITTLLQVTITHANFEFTCSPNIKTKQDCLSAYSKYLDKACCTDQKGEKYQEIKTPSDFCGINDHNTTCNLEFGNILKCSVESASCHSVDPTALTRAPPIYNCINGENYIPVFSEQTSIRYWWKSAESENPVIVRKPHFCIEQKALKIQDHIKVRK